MLSRGVHRNWVYPRLVLYGKALSTFFLTRRRGTCIWLGFAVVLLLTLFPPWLQVRGGGDYPIRQIRLWHAPFFHEPLQGRYFAVIVDYRRMLTEFVAGEAFVLALYFTWARPSR